jgi:DNA recombination protein RmuC
MSETLLIVVVIAVLAVLVISVFLALRVSRSLTQMNVELTAAQALTQAELARVLEDKHRGMLTDLHSGLTQHGDRIGGHLTESGERLRGSVGQELTATRDSLYAMKLSLSESLAESRAAMVRQLTETQQQLNAKIDERLDQIAGKVNERLDEGFRKTNETFVSVMQRLATIDEAQKKIENLTGSVVSLQELLGDKRSRGAFGEVQLEHLVRNVMPPQAFEMQYTLSTGVRADCVLKLPDPTGMVAVDSKFPLENYHKMFGDDVNEVDRALAQKQFRADIRKHVDDIAKKYIIPNETSDGAVMFVPAEAVFAEIHAYHSEVVDYANTKRVWIVSPTTLMAVLNTARAVLKDVETRKQVHVIKEALGRLGADFRRFDERMKKLADHIRQAHQDAEDVQTSSRKISAQFAKIEAAEIEDHRDGSVQGVVPLESDGKS